MRRKIKILLLIVLLLNINTNKIFAYTAEGEGTGTGVTLHGSWCGPNDACFGGYSVFEVRITLLNEKLERVEGTKVVEFRAIQPAAGENPSVTHAYDINNVRYAEAKNNSREWSYYLTEGSLSKGGLAGQDFLASPKKPVFSAKVDLDYNQRQITFLGTSRTRDGMLPENTELNRHDVYMGFGDTVVEDVLDGANIPNLRSKFMNYITSLDKKNYVEGYGNVSFIDYFLHVSGFSKSWEASNDIDILKQIRDGHYYLMIEPVHHPAVRINGIWYGVDGTSQQLAEFSYYNDYFEESPWSYYRGTDYLHNAFCNFMDYNSILTNYSEDRILELCNILTYESYYSVGYSYMNTLGDLQQASNPYGVTMVDLNQKWKDLTDMNECVYDVDTCNDNDFVFEVKFSALDNNQTEISSKTNIASCIYGMDEQNREKYYYTATSATGKKLYCYDDLTYDFKKLKKLEDQNFKTNTFAKIENGVLNVDRTCFSTAKFDDTTLLNNILVDDNIGSKNYQEEFTFNFLGKNYTFKRDDTINNGSYNETEEKDKKNIIYTYTSSFSYYYKLEQGFNTEQANILINDYSINNGLPDKNSIYINKDSSNAKVINVSQKESNKYTNELNSQLNNGYGLNTKAIEILNSNPGTIISSETNMDRRGTVYSTESKVNLHIVSDNNNICKFDATVTNANGTQFRVISLSNPFPARDGTSRIPGKNWLNESENNVYEYIQNNRNVNSEQVYQQEPLYTVTLDTKTMIKIREYNKYHSYSDYDITCETGTGRMCIDNFIRNDYINLDGVCKDLKAEEMPEITQVNKEITNLIINGCAGSTQCMQLNQEEVQKIDNNKDGYIDEKDYLNSKFYTCADKTAKSGG